MVLSVRIFIYKIFKSIISEPERSAETYELSGNSRLSISSTHFLHYGVFCLAEIFTNTHKREGALKQGWQFIESRRRQTNALDTLYKKGGGMKEST